MAVDQPFTMDAFHRGNFHVVQPAKGAHRAGIDAMLLAACVVDQSKPFKVADFGAGAGAAGLAVAARCENAFVTLIERDATMIECARKTVALRENGAMANRIDVNDIDITHLPNEALGENTVDWVIMNPPFNDASDRQTPHQVKSGAHVMEDGLFENWLRKAATVLHAKGSFALIARPQSLQNIVDAADRRFGALQVMPVYPRQSEDAIRILVRGTKGSRKRLELNPPLILHPDEGGAFTSHAEALINGNIAIA
ncbi:MAG: methyltransferase [Pseudomonadota bacterium]